MDEKRAPVMDIDRRLQDKGTTARNPERLDDDIAEQGQRGEKDQPRDDDRMSER